MSSRKNILVCFALIAMLLILTGCSISLESESSQKSSEDTVDATGISQDHHAKQDFTTDADVVDPSELNYNPALKYSTVIKMGSHYTKNNKQGYRYELAITSDLPENPSKDDLLALAKFVVSDILLKSEPTEIVISIYDVKNHPSFNPVARVVWTDDGEVSFDNSDVNSSSAKSQSSAAAPNTSSTSSSSYNSTSTGSSYYSIVDAVFEDLSYNSPGSNSECVRVQYRIWIETDGKASRNAVQALARDLAAQVTSRFDINALSIFVYDGPDMYGEYTIASVDWAPYGNWGRADEVSTGDYSKHSYTIRMR